jgi:hypothetical protein
LDRIGAGRKGHHAKRERHDHEAYGDELRRLG